MLAWKVQEVIGEDKGYYVKINEYLGGYTARIAKWDAKQGFITIGTLSSSNLEELQDQVQYKCDCAD